MVLKAPKKLAIDDEEVDRTYKIIAENLHKTYLLGKTAVAALRGVNVQIKEAEFVGLYGPSGSGKHDRLVGTRVAMACASCRCEDARNSL